MIPDPRELRLHEEVLLLALDDEKGTTSCGDMYAQAIGGAAVAELLLAGRIRMSEDGKGKVELVDATPVGEPLLDELLAEIAGKQKPRKGRDWVAWASRRKGLKERIARGLVERGILGREEVTHLWVFTSVRYPERDARAERAVRDRLRRAIFGGEDPGPRTLILVALGDATGLLKRNFDKHELKRHKDRIEQIARGEAVGTMAKEAVQAVQAAVMVAVIMPAVVTTSTS